MADLSDDEVTRLYEQFKSKFSDLNKLASEEMRNHEDYIKTLLKSTKSIESTAEIVKKMVKSFSDIIRKSATSIELEIKELTKSVNDGTITLDGLDRALEKLRDDIKHTTDSSKIADLNRKKSELERIRLTEQSTKIFGETLGAAGIQMAQGVANTLKSMAISAMSSGDGMATASKAIEGSIDLAAGAANSGAKALTGVGTAAMAAGGKLAGAGLAAAAVGTAMGGLTGIISELAKAGVGFLLTQTQKTIASFQTMSSSGAVFSGGMEEMRRVALESGVTLEAFSKIVSANASRMAEGGMTMGEATKELSKVGAAVKRSGIERSLTNLGLSFEEQTELQAKIISDMNRGRAANQRVSAEDAAKATQELAENMRMLSSITGEDAKSKAEKVKAENTEYAFQAKMLEMSPEQRAQIDTAMAGLNESERRNLRERFVTGGTRANKMGSMYEATTAGAEEKGIALYEALKNNQLTATTAADTSARYSGQIKSSTIENAKSIGVAGMFAGGVAGELSKTLGEALKQSLQFTPENVAEVKKAIVGAMAGGGSEAITDAMRQSRDFGKELERVATNNLSKFNDALGTVIKMINSSVGAVGGASATMAANPMLTTILGSLAGIVQLLGAWGLSKMGGSASSSPSKRSSVGPTKSPGRGRRGAARADISEVVGEGMGASVGGFLSTVSTGLGALAKPQVLIGLGAVTLAVMGLSKAFEIASPGFEKFGIMTKTIFEGAGSLIKDIGTSISTVVSSLTDSLISLSSVDSTKLASMGLSLLALAPGVAALGLSLIPFAAGGALASLLTGELTPLVDQLTALSSVSGTGLLSLAPGIVAVGAALVPFAVGGVLTGLMNSTGGLGSMVDQLSAFSNLDSAKLITVSDAVTKVTASLPSVTDIAKMAALNLIKKTPESEEKKTLEARAVETPKINAGESPIVAELKVLSSLVEKQGSALTELVGLATDHKRIAGQQLTVVSSMA